MAIGDGARVVRIAFYSALAGATYGYLVRGSLLPGAIGGAATGGALTLLEIYAINRRMDGWLGRLPFVAYFALRAGMYFVVVVFFNFVVSATASGHVAIAVIERRDLEFALAVCVVGNLLISVNELLGPGVLFAVAAGRYRRPRRERRVLLYADMVGSTALAERLGEERFLDLLNAFFADLAAAIVAEGGEIHKYVGDEAIAVWRAEADPAAPIRACFSARRRIAARAGFYQAAFGATPAFRAALHEGPVVLGELGALKKEIALIGDAMNTAARILEAAREAGAFALASSILLDRLAATPAGLVAEPLPPVALRGKSTPLQLVSLAERPAALPLS